MDEERSINRRDLLKIGVAGAGAVALGLTGVGNLFGAELAATARLSHAGPNRAQGHNPQLRCHAHPGV